MYPLKFNIRILVFALLLQVSGGLCAEKSEETPPEKKPATSTDICIDAVDPYNPGAEKMKFFKAAGVDIELSAEECEADRTREKCFVRKFDSFKSMLPFDKDGSGTMDWFEIDDYRRDLRRRVLEGYDLNDNGMLDGDERLAASKALLTGKLVTARKQYSYRKSKGKKSSEDPWASIGAAPEKSKSKSKSSSGKSKYGSKEKKASDTSSREQKRQAALVKRWDRDRDGKLSEKEKAEMEEYYKKKKQQAEEYKKKKDEFRKRADANGDGQLDTSERKAYYELIKEYIIQRRYDRDGDGQLNEKERAELEKDRNRRKKKK